MVLMLKEKIMVIIAVTAMRNVTHLTKLSTKLSTKQLTRKSATPLTIKSATPNITLPTRRNVTLAIARNAAPATKLFITRNARFITTTR